MTLIDSYDTTPVGARYLTDVPTNNNYARGQTFRPSASYVVTSIKLRLRRSSLAPVGYVVARIYAHTGTFGTNGLPTGSPLCTSEQYDVSGLTTSYALIEFTFTAGASLVDSTAYCVVLETVAGSTFDASHYVWVGCKTTGGTHEGNAFRYFGGQWVTDTVDFYFYLYGDEDYEVDIHSIPDNLTDVAIATNLEVQIDGLSVITLSSMVILHKYGFYRVFTMYN